MKIVKIFLVPLFSFLSLSLLVWGMIKGPWPSSWLFFFWGFVQVVMHAVSGPIGALTTVSIGSLVGLSGIALNISRIDQWPYALIYLLGTAWLWFIFWWSEKNYFYSREAIQIAQENIENADRSLSEIRLEVEKSRKMFGGLEARRDVYERLSDLVDSLATSLSIEQLNQHITDSLGKYLGPGRAEFIVFDDEDRLSKRDSISAWIERYARSLLIRDISRSPYIEWKTIDYQGTSLIAAPLFQGKKPIGMLRMFSNPPHVFDEPDLRLLTTVADICALALANIRLYAQVESLASQDTLTELFVRYRFDEKLAESFATATRVKASLCLVMFDIDLFKNINDLYGHQVGDRVLKEVSKVIKSSCRDTDFAARYGGEEITVIMPYAKLEEAKVFAERVRQAVQAISLLHQGKEVKVTVSAGVACISPSVKKPEDLLEEVDKVLYRAKSGGRNRVVVSTKGRRTA